MGACVAAGAAAQGVRFVHHQLAAVATDDVNRALPEAGLGQDHADVGHHRFGQHAGHIAQRQRGLQCGEVVEFDDARGGGQTVHLAQQAVALHGAAVGEIDEHVIARVPLLNPWVDRVA